jgi:hypothetical protein
MKRMTSATLRSVQKKLLENNELESEPAVKNILP